jgi:RimJ/RimL family protein N-acetyltransferase
MYARRGFMKEALGAVITHLFEKEKLDCVCARAFVPNEASRALLRSLGFRENGVIPLCVKGYGDVIFDDVIHTLFPKDLK